MAITYVAESRIEMMDEREEEKVMRTWPDDVRLVDWFRQAACQSGPDPGDGRHRRTSPAGASFPPPLTFWARRQPNETAIHRADAESPPGNTPFPPSSPSTRSTSCSSGP